MHSLDPIRMTRDGWLSEAGEALDEAEQAGCEDVMKRLEDISNKLDAAPPRKSRFAPDKRSPEDQLAKSQAEYSALLQKLENLVVPGTSGAVTCRVNGFQKLTDLTVTPAFLGPVFKLAHHFLGAIRQAQLSIILTLVDEDVPESEPGLWEFEYDLPCESMIWIALDRRRRYQSMMAAAEESRVETRCELAEIRQEATIGGGMVELTIDGYGVLQSLAFGEDATLQEVFDLLPLALVEAQRRWLDSLERQPIWFVVQGLPEFFAPPSDEDYQRIVGKILRGRTSGLSDGFDSQESD